MNRSFSARLTRKHRAHLGAAGATGAAFWIALLLAAGLTEAASAPAIRVRPHITGTASVGSTLTTTKGTWTGSPRRYAYRWWHCMPKPKGGCKPSMVSNRTRYVVRASDAGGTIYVAVQARNSSGRSPYVGSANRIGPIAPRGAPVNTTSPYASGTLAPARAVSTTAGSWSGPVSGYRYQWFECDSSSGGRCTEARPISGATDDSYVINPRLLGDDLYVTVSAYNRSGSATPVMSNLIGPITGTALVPPFNEEKPSIRGKAVVGSTLGVDVGDWDGLPDAYSYQWLHCDPRNMECQRINRQNGATYLVQGDVLGKLIRVSVIARNATGWSEVAVSRPVGPASAR